MATRIESRTDAAVDTAMLSRNWWAVAIRGIAAIIFGVLTLLLPGITLAALILLFGAYALVDGVFALVAAARGRDETQPWWALVIEGVLSIAAGIVTFAWPGLTTLVLFYVIGSWAIITGVLEIVAAVRLRKEMKGEVWLALSGALSIAFGLLVYLFPVAGALALVLWTGAYAIVFGALLVGLSLRLRNARRHEQRAPLVRAA